MEKEILTCTVCSCQWERYRTRGRKPKLCPDCINSRESESEIHYVFNDNDDIYEQTSVQIDTSLYLYPAKTKWRCSSCDVKFQTFVALQFPPAHKCQKKAGRFLSFEVY